MNKNLIGLSIMMVVGIILVGAVLMPVLNENVNPDKISYTNNGSISAALIENGDSGEVFVDGTTIHTKINGVTQTWSSGGAVNPLYGENVYLNHNASASVFTLTYNDGTEVKTVSSLTSVSWSAKNGKLSMTANATTYEVDLGHTFIWGDSGDYTCAFKQNNSTIYYSESDPYLLSTGAVSILNNKPTPSSLTLTNNAALVEGTQDIYTVKYSAADYLIHNGDESIGAGVWMIVSKEVNGLGPEKVPATQKALYGVIPLMILVALLTIAVKGAIRD